MKKIIITVLLLVSIPVLSQTIGEKFQEKNNDRDFKPYKVYYECIGGYFHAIIETPHGIAVTPVFTQNECGNRMAVKCRIKGKT